MQEIIQQSNTTPDKDDKTKNSGSFFNKQDENVNTPNVTMNLNESNVLPADETEEISLVKIEKYLQQWQQINQMLYEKFSKKYISILTTNICGYEYEEKINDRIMLQRHNDIVFPAIEGHKGNLTRSSGNLVVGTFEDPVDAVRAAIDIQIKINNYNYRIMTDETKEKIKIKVGISMGQVMLDGENLYGDAIKQAALLQFQAMDEEIFISGAVYEKIKNVKDIECEFHKKIRIKGKRKSIEMYEVIWPKISYETIGARWVSVNSPPEMPMTFLNSWGMLVIIQAIILIFYIVLK